LLNNVGIIFKHTDDSTWNILYDYGATQPKLYGPFSYPEYSEYIPLDLEVSWEKPQYFWWTLWTNNTNGTSGLLRQNVNKANTKYVVFANDYGELKDLSINKYGKPFILWQNTNGEAVVERYGQDGKYQTKFVFPAPDNTGWEATNIVMDYYNRIRLLWTKGSQYKVEQIVFNGLKKTWTPIMNIPENYSIADFDTGWSKNDQHNRLMFINNNGQVNIQKISMSGSKIKDFNFSAPGGYEWHSMETTSDNRIQLMLTSETGLAQVWKVNHNTGVVESVKDYAM